MPGAFERSALRSEGFIDAAYFTICCEIRSPAARRELSDLDGE